MAAMDPDALARAFVDHYYNTFDTNRPALVGLYQDSSMLSFEGDKIQGAAAISAKLAGLPFQQCLHKISTIDCQPSGPAGGMLVFASGSIQLAGEQHVLKFSQTHDPYYNAFDVNRVALVGLYQETLKLSFEGDRIQDAAAVMPSSPPLPFYNASTRYPPTPALRLYQ